MKNILFLLLTLGLLTACGQTRTESADAPESEESLVDGKGYTSEKGTEATSQHNSALSQPEPPAEKADFDFLGGCETLDTWYGAVQGVPEAEAGGLYLMGQCFSDRSYDIIVYSNRKISMDEGVDAKSGAIKPGIAGATYYAFEIPKKQVTKPEDGIEPFEYIFPSEVKVYRLQEGEWHLLEQKTVNTFQELGRLKINTLRKGATNA